MDEQSVSPTGAQPAPQQVSPAHNQKLMSVLAYLGLLIIIPFLVAKDDAVVKFHIKQGLVLIVIELTAYVIGMMLWQLWPLLQLVNLATLVLAIIGVVNVVNNRACTAGVVRRACGVLKFVELAVANNDELVTPIARALQTIAR